MIKNKSVIFLLALSLTIAFNITLFTNSLIFESNVENLHENTDDLYDLRVSGPEITITTPENKTYYEPMGSYYPATYGFENEIDGTSGTDIGFIDLIDASCSVDVVSEIDDHSKVLYYNTPIDHRWTRNYFDTSHTWGIVEFWIRLGETDKRHVIYLSDGSGGSISLNWFEDGYVKFDNRTNGGDIEIIEAYNALQWYHVRIEFDVATDWHLWIDGVSKDGGSGYGYYNIPSGFNEFIFGGLADNDIWLDAVGYSWDTNYNVKDNFYKGLLLSYENSPSLDWIGYSLDGQSNKTILGNTTIPFLNEGIHTIQVFGNDSFGTLFQSQIKHFSIDTTAPTSMISFTPYRDPDIVIKSTFFTITADDGLGSGVSLIRYKINGLSWNTYTGPFNLSTYDYDNYDITYQAIDEVGHIESENTITITLIPEPSEPGISGFNVFLIICVISLVSAILIKKKFK